MVLGKLPVPGRPANLENSRTQELVFKSKIRLSSPDRRNSRSLSRRRKIMKHRNFIRGQNLFRRLLKHYYIDYDRDIAILL